MATHIMGDLSISQLNYLKEGRLIIEIGDDELAKSVFSANSPYLATEFHCPTFIAEAQNRLDTELVIQWEPYYPVIVAGDVVLLMRPDHWVIIQIRGIPQ